MRVIVIGAGASGMMAALTAAEDKSNTVVLLERQARVGRKLLATGNGRCNLLNTGDYHGHYFGSSHNFADYALEKFNPNEIIKYFSSLGLLSVEQYGGRVYPSSDSANSVVDVLRFALSSFGVDVKTSQTVKAVGHKNGTFNVITDSSVFSGDALIVACGGKAGGKLGGVSDGYDILKSFGHHITKLYPALVPISTDDEYTRSLKGVRCDARLSIKGKCVRGELQFTEKGISGPAAFDISRIASTQGGIVDIDLLPDTDEIVSILRNRLQTMPDLDCGSILTGILHNRLGIVVVKYAGIRPSAAISSLNDDDLMRIQKCCKHFILRIKGVGNFESAQITVGGASTDEFNNETMCSKLITHLYACGEVLDIDADCGGYNLRWAWASGRLAGKLL